MKHPPAESSTPPRGRRLPLVIKILVPVILLVLGGVGARIIYVTRPRPAKQKPEPLQALVEVQTVHPDTHRVVIEAMGAVIPARVVVLKSRVAGEILDVHPEYLEGGRVQKGDALLGIDPVDYELAIERAKGELARAEFELDLERGRQEIAKQEWELLGKGREASDTERNLALRVPHLKQVEAAFNAARADLRRAEINLQRTIVRAPFDAVVLSREVERGTQVREQDPLATVIDRSEYWVRVSLPLDRLSWIDVPRKDGEPGSEVRVIASEHQGSGIVYTGAVLRLQAELEQQGRMAQVLVSVKDPLGFEADPARPPLLIDSYVRVEIQGRELRQVVGLPRSALRENDNIWIADADDRLEIRPIKPLWKSRERVLVAEALQDGEKLIVSDLSMPVAGMPLILQSAAGQEPERE